MTDHDRLIPHERHLYRLDSLRPDEQRAVRRSLKVSLIFLACLLIASVVLESGRAPMPGVASARPTQLAGD
jgi:hypothetical protein